MKGLCARIWTYLFGAVILLASSGVSSRNTHMSTSDYLMRIKCRAKCLSDIHGHLCDYEMCLKELRGEHKLGSCPSSSSMVIHPDPHHHQSDSNETASNYLMDSNCMDVCASWDYNCPEAERCCSNGCGASCHRPVDLEQVPLLPPVPCKLSAMESRRKIEICWNIFEEIRVRKKGSNYWRRDRSFQ